MPHRICPKPCPAPFIDSTTRKNHQAKWCGGQGGLPWGGLSAVSFGIVLHLFSASIFSQKVFRGSKITRVFLQPFCNLRLWQSTGAWQAGYDRRAHGEDIRLKSSASASKWHEYRGPRNPLTLQDVSASLAGLGAGLFFDHPQPGKIQGASFRVFPLNSILRGQSGKDFN